MNTRRLLAPAAGAGLCVRHGAARAAGKVYRIGIIGNGVRAAMEGPNPSSRSLRAGVAAVASKTWARSNVTPCLTSIWSSAGSSGPRLPAPIAPLSIQPTLEYDAKVHALAGPLLVSVLEAAGVAPGGDGVALTLRAVDGYAVKVSLADARRYRMIVATWIDGRPLALGGLGPQWAVYDADTLVPFKDQPLKERFALCPWGLYHVDVKRG